MTELRFEPYVMPAADLGQPNPLPDITSTTDIHAQIKLDESISEEEGQYFGYGRVNGILPYLIQDDYNRDKKPRAFNAAVLENDYIKAVFLPELGGRLWSLFDKSAQRELLHVNPVFQPANLALRNAWISGGVEWNIGMTGHTPFTVSQMFTARTSLEDGTPVLRMYEWERVRRAAYQIDAYLPEDSRFLMLRIRILNTQGEVVPIYWWSNMAADEREDVRVLVPAEKAFKFGYSRSITKVGFPGYEGIDASYSMNINHAVDFFFDIPEPRRRWISAIDKEGRGLVQTSTDRLQGRKLFVWGTNPGGRRWQEYLAAPGHQYLEIQAGVAHTQSECLPLPAKACWEWVEAYGLMEVDAQTAHGQDWGAAWGAVDLELEKRLPRGYVDGQLARLRDELDGKEAELISRGSGWGALERMRLEKQGAAFNVGDMVYDEASLTSEQAAWAELLKTGSMPCPDVDELPESWMIQDYWRELLEKSIAAGGSDHWYGWLQLGVLRYAADDLDGAKAAWERSIELKPSAFAKRNLAAIAKKSGEADAACELYMQAVRMMPGIRQLAVECGQCLKAFERSERFLELLPALPQAVQAHGRIRLLEAEARYAIGDLDGAERILMQDFEISDVREGELSLSDLWVNIQARRIANEQGVPVDQALIDRAKAEFPVPRHLDFRMQGGA